MTEERLNVLRTKIVGPDVTDLIAEVDRLRARERQLLGANNAELERRREADRQARAFQITADALLEESVKWSERGLEWDALKARVADWLRTRVGTDYIGRQERAMRLLEESIELAQAEGVTADQVTRQAAHVYARPTGDPEQEMGGVLVCMLGWCEATHTRPVDLARREVERIEAKPIESIRSSLARKQDAGLVTSEEVQHGDEN